MTQKHKTLADNILAWASLLTSAATLGAGILGTVGNNTGQSARAVTDRLRAEGLYLKNQLTAQKIHTENHTTAKRSNEVVITDQKIEENQLKLALLKDTVEARLGSGSGSTKFKAERYADPGDVRRGILPPKV